MIQFSQWQISEIKTWPFATENRDILLKCWLKARNISGKWSMKHTVRCIESITTESYIIEMLRLKSSTQKLKNAAVRDD